MPCLRANNLRILKFRSFLSLLRNRSLRPATASPPSHSARRLLPLPAAAAWQRCQLPPPRRSCRRRWPPTPRRQAHRRVSSQEQTKLHCTANMPALDVLKAGWLAVWDCHSSLPSAVKVRVNLDHLNLMLHFVLQLADRALCLEVANEGEGLAAAALLVAAPQGTDLFFFVNNVQTAVCQALWAKHACPVRLHNRLPHAGNDSTACRFVR